MLIAYWAKRIPADVRPKVQVGYRIEFTQREWRLYCQQRDSRGHADQALPAVSGFAKLLGEVDADPTGILWG
jgi:DUF3024 family protein